MEIESISRLGRSQGRHLFDLRGSCNQAEQGRGDYRKEKGRCESLEGSAIGLEVRDLEKGQKGALDRILNH